MPSQTMTVSPLDFHEVMERAHQIGEQLMGSEEMKRYLELRKQMDQDHEAMASIASFNQMKEAYEEVQRFGKYHPDYNKVTREIRQKKREMEKIASIAAFKQAEDALDELLYRVSRTIADAVSDNIKVPSNNPLYEMMGGGCGSGGCGTGGGCGCSAK